MSCDQTDAGFRSITPLQAKKFTLITCKDCNNKNILIGLNNKTVLIC
jgi:hypothetical protein